MRLTEVTKSYVTRAGVVPALRDVTLTSDPARMTAVMGPSGSGKSTLLQCAAGLDRPSGGSIMLAGQDLATLDEEELAVVRREHLGFIFQAFNLVPMLTVAENIVLPVRLAGRRVRSSEVTAALSGVGLSGLEHRYPGELSGGQQQRTAIARTLLAKPDILFADEPTGALDVRTGRQILGLLREAVDRHGQTVVMVTHDPAAAAVADRVVYLVDGKIAGESHDPAVGDIMGAIAQWDG